MAGKFIQIDHPLLRHKLGLLRDVETASSGFREMTREISRLMVYEMMRDWSDCQQIKIKTPLAETTVDRIIEPPIVVTVMRAGNIMMDGVLDMLPLAPAGHIGIYRDKFINNTVEYYFKIPQKSKNRPIILCDPLIATGDTMVAALDRLKNYEVGPIRIMSILVSGEAVEKIHYFHPDVDIFCLNKEEGLTKEGYLVPGLGDAGDRLFHTK